MAKKEAPPEYGTILAELRTAAHEQRAKVEELKKEIQKREELAGNIEGGIITANETRRHDPERALEQILRIKPRL